MVNMFEGDTDDDNMLSLLLLFYHHFKHLSSCRDGQLTLTTLFLGRLRPPKPLTSTSCTYFCQ